MGRTCRILWAAVFLAAARPVQAELFAQAMPVKYNLTVRPGESVVRDVMVNNLGNGPVVVRVRYSDWTLSDEGLLSLAPPGSTPGSLSGCVRFEPRDFSLQPGESGRVQVILTLPAEGPATRWGVLLSEVIPASTPRTGLGPRAVAELGTTLYLSSVPASQIHPRLSRMDVSPVGQDSLMVSFRIHNDGDRHLYVGSEIAIRDSLGSAVMTGNVGTGVVLPGRSRVFAWTCAAGLPPGGYTVAATLDTGEPELMVGESRIRWPMIATVGPPLAQQPESR